MKASRACLLLSAALLIGSVAPSWAAACRPRMSPLACFFASLQELGAPAHARPLRRHARPRVRHAAASRHRAVTHVATRRPAHHALRAAALSVAPAAIVGATRPLQPDAPEPSATPSPVVDPPASLDPAEPAPEDRLRGDAEPVAPADAARDEPAANRDATADLAQDEPTPSTAALMRESAPPSQAGVDAGSSIRRLFGLAGETPQSGSDWAVGTQVAPDVDLQPLPAAFTEVRPYFAELRYFIADDRILLVLPETRRIVMSY